MKRNPHFLVQGQQSSAADWITVEIEPAKAVFRNASDGAGATGKEAQGGDERLVVERLDGPVSRRRREDNPPPWSEVVRLRKRSEEQQSACPSNSSCLHQCATSYSAVRR